MQTLAPSILLGGATAFILAVLGATWSWFGGASAILAVSGAREIQKPDDPQLFNVVEELSIAAGVPMPRVYLIEDSAMNAFATGRDPRHAAVAITRGLRDKLNRDELQGVLAHEMSHVRHYDIRFSMLMATMVGLIVFACDAFWRIIWYSRPGYGGGRRGRSKEGGGPLVLILIILAVVLAVIAPIIARIIQMAYSRQREYLADAGSVELTRNPLGLAGALQKLGDDTDPLVDTANRGTAHLYIVNPLRKMRRAGQALDSMFLSHPPIKDRIARLLALTR
jgi:heat shock protein HtpX